MALTVGSLFAGIGGMDLGFERAGCKIAWQVEIDEWCRRVLAKHWPGVHRHGDIKTFLADTEHDGFTATARPGDDGRVQQPAGRAQEPESGEQSSPGSGNAAIPGYVDIICGGFPCQDLSYAGTGAGLDGDRSGLWHEMLRVIRVVRPRYVLVENVPALLNRGMGVVVGGLAQSGYDCEWDCIPACAVGAPHRRDRVWIVARCNSDSRREFQYANSGRLKGSRPESAYEDAWASDQAADWWAVEPGFCRVANGIPSRVDRLKGLGNAVVPQVVRWIAERIVTHAIGQG